MNGRDRVWRAFGWRWCKFSLVGAVGMVVQLCTLALLTAAGVHYLLATVLAVEAAVLQNFAWHHNFTWSDREGRILGRLARFHLTNGAISILGNLALMRLLVGGLGMPPVSANLASMTACFAANFFAADRLVFLAGVETGLCPVWPGRRTRPHTGMGE
ncbi:MAG TPA: GtrA family protein [Terriglobales bacterium]|nr:GtrA family protein [Terriglobales bacterium]